MKQWLLDKFSHNSVCFKTLETTGRSTIAEASPSDKLWGGGLGMKDANLANKQLWMGIIGWELCSCLLELN